MARRPDKAKIPQLLLWLSEFPLASNICDESSHLCGQPAIMVRPNVRVRALHQLVFTVNNDGGLQ